MKAIVWNIIGLVFLFLLDFSADALTPQIIEDDYNVRARTV